MVDGEFCDFVVLCVSVWNIYLKPSHKEAVCCQLCEARDSILQQGEDAPAHVQEGYQVVHGDHGEQKHEGYLADDCSDHI